MHEITFTVTKEEIFRTNMTNKVLVIVGMQRSGTSLISNWLYKCGLHLGDEILGPGIGNTEGHYEDVDFLHLHKKF